MGIAGVILGIVAIICALIAPMLFGTTGAIITAVIAAIGIVLAVMKRVKDKKGGIAGIMMAFSLNGTWTNTFQELHKKAVELKPDGLWAQVTESTDGGIMGIISRLPNQDEATLQAFVDEANELNKLSGNTEATAAPAEATEAPAEEATEAPAEEATEAPAA